MPPTHDHLFTRAHTLEKSFKMFGEDTKYFIKIHTYGLRKAKKRQFKLWQRYRKRVDRHRVVD